MAGVRACQNGSCRFGKEILMNKKQYFEKYNSQLLLEAWLKSILSALCVGFLVGFAVSFVCWLFPFGGLWVAAVAALGGAVLSCPIFYLTKFRTSVTDDARRLDRLGLEERLVTMVEYENDESYIARLQRKNAEESLANLGIKRIKLIISKATLTVLAVSFVLFGAMYTVDVLSNYGVIRGGDDIIDEIVEQRVTEYVVVLYEIEDGGMIDGDEEQIIELGTDAAAVTAVAEDGFIFKEWSDGSKAPTRIDRKVSEDLVLYAVFEPIEDEDDGADGDGDGEADSDKPSDEPAENGGEGEGEESDDPPPPGSETGDKGNGKWEPNNQVIDGSTFYKDVIDSYREEAEALLEREDSGLTDAEKEMIKKYLGIL